MGQVSIAILAGCLKALGWMLWATSGLLILLVIVQALRGDSDAVPRSNLLVAAAFFIAGGACAWAARRVARLQ